MLAIGWLGASLIVLVLLGTALAYTLAYALRSADGPVGPLPGGPLRSGPLVPDHEIDWSFASEVSFIEIQLEAPPRSRTTGILVHDGELYVPCDLGFIWRRVAPPGKWLMALVWWVKRWHQDVLRDGRVVIRVRGRRYERQAVRVDDPTLIESLSTALEAKAEKFVGAPLAPRPAEPGPIWFFRLDPRAVD